MNIKSLKTKLQQGSCLMLLLTLPASGSKLYASDIELYRAPQASQTTLMFMLDISGSMNPNGNNAQENRLESLKKGMTTLLRGDNRQGISPLEDKLVVGLATFNKSTGRIALEARPLGEPVRLQGTREVFRVVNQIQQTTQATRSRNRTQSSWEARTQQQTRSCFLGCSAWSRWSESAWGTQSSSTDWQESTTPWSTSSPEVVVQSISQECNKWNTNYTCAADGWVATERQASDFAGTVATVTTGNVSYTDISNGNTSSSQRESLKPDVVTGQENCTNSSLFWGCTRNERVQTQNRKDVTFYEETPITAVARFPRTTTYTGAAYESHRTRMLQQVNALKADDSTPTGYAYAEVAAYLMGQSTKGQTGSGFNESVEGSIRDQNNYKKPAQIDSTQQCNTQGIYFLTDGEPQYYYNKEKNTLEDFMKKALGNKGSNFSCSSVSSLGRQPGNYSNNGTMNYPNGWDCIGAFTQALLDPKLNPAQVDILTAVVGFGSGFSSGSGNDVKDAQLWGSLGKGGWYAGSDDKAVIESVNTFVKKLGKYIPSVTIGSVTLPVDALDTQNVQPWGYFPQFDPKPDAVGQAGVVTWLGNLKKYRVVSNVLYDRNGGVITETDGNLKDDTNDYWADTAIKKWIEKEENGEKKSYEVKVGGALSRMLLGYRAESMPRERRIFTDRTLQKNPNDNSQIISSNLSSGDLITLGRSDFVNTSKTFYNQDPKRAYLASLFGYPISKALAYNIELYPQDQNFQSELEQSLSQAPRRDWLMGAVMHSRPLMITQKGTTTQDKDGVLTYTNRDDLIVVGTTQGMLHVFRAGSDAQDQQGGKEIFSFVPNEMIENQAKGFLSQDNQSSELKYGIDGQWTAYTEYLTKVGASGTPEVTVKGAKQWLYGGLRMGGRSYYALDLSDITAEGGTPKLKFRIYPSGQCSTQNPLGCMGQSWSKPTITWVNWQGSRRLVMLVGGGYDPNYETAADYRPAESHIDQGAGVYMFDANTGQLLWWASAQASETQSNQSYHADLKRSVVGSIKAIDRDGDGVADHLYFGDLGGQLWRIDLNRSAYAGLSDQPDVNVADRIVRLAKINKSHPARFYTTPTFSLHSSNQGLFAALSIGSGNLSFPMSASAATDDAMYVVFDKDVTRRNLSQLSENELYSRNADIGNAGNRIILNQDGNTAVTLANAGWYYPLGAQKRILNDQVAIDHDLYVSVFDASKDLVDLNCSGGVRGESQALQFCLPYGQCSKRNSNGQLESVPRPAPIFLGKGNIGISFGGIDHKRGIVLNIPTQEPLKRYTGQAKFVAQRWFER